MDRLSAELAQLSASVQRIAAKIGLVLLLLGLSLALHLALSAAPPVTRAHAVLRALAP